MATKFFYSFTIKFTRPLNAQRNVLANVNYRTGLALGMAGQKKLFSKCVITPNVKLNSLFPVVLEKKTNSVPKLKGSEIRPLVVLFEYLNAKEKHIRKFIDFYMDFGFDVLQVHLKPFQLLWPTKGSQVCISCHSNGHSKLMVFTSYEIVAKDVAQFFAINPTFSPMVIHGFSVGGYLWGEILVHFSKNIPLYQPVIDKIKCKIFDSAVDVNEIPKGFPQALFPKNQILRSAFEKYLRYHLKAFYEESTKHYNQSRLEFSRGIVKCPTLMITSDSDPLSSVLVNETVRQELAALDLECYVKVFKGSSHVAHFKMHRQEYIAEIETLLAKVAILQPQKLKAKL